MSGAGSRKSVDATTQPAPTAAPRLGSEAPGAPTDDDKDDDDDNDDNGDQDLGNDDSSDLPDTDGGNGQAIVPDGVVDGMEVINNCSRCVARARQLSPQAGFTADVSRTFNLGFYKIEPSQNLCDIHFMADMRLPIGDHEGRDSVLDRQIALYCPCNCGWAVNM